MYYHLDSIFPGIKIPEFHHLIFMSFIVQGKTYLQQKYPYYLQGHREEDAKHEPKQENLIP